MENFKLNLFMKKYLLILLSLVALSTNAQLQFGNQTTIKSLVDSLPASVNITTQDLVSSTATGMNSQSIITGTPTANSSARFGVSGKQTLDVLISGTWTGTLQSEISFDNGTTWFMRGLHQMGTSYTTATFTANAAGNLNVAGVTNYRLRATAAMTGTASVRISSSMNGSTFYLANGVRITDPVVQSQQLSITAGGAAKIDGSATTQPVSGTFFQATQPISNAAIGVGQKDQANALSVTLSNQNVKDSLVTGQAAQTATVNNILTTTAGSNPTNVIGFRSFTTQVVSTGTGGTWLFEESLDNVNYQPVFVINTMGNAVIGSAIGATNSAVLYKGSISGNFLRLRIVTTITGGSIQAFSKFSQISYANSGTIPVSAAGPTANSVASSGNPLRIGGRIAPATPDLSFVPGDAADAMISTSQQLIDKSYSPAENDYTFNGNINNSTVASVFKNAAGASLRNYVTGLTLASDALTTATTVVIRDGAVSSTSVAANVLTSGIHDYKIGDAVVFSAVGSYTGIVTATTYYVLTVPSATTYTLSATPNGGTLTVTGSGTATSNRILFRTKLSTAGISTDQILFSTPLRGIPNGTMDIQTETASTVGVVYYNIQGFIAF